MTLSRHRRHLSTESNLLPSSSLPRSALSASFTDKHTSDSSPTHRNGTLKMRESPCGSLKRQKYFQTTNAMSTSGPSSLESNHRGSMKTLKNDSKSGSSSLESQSMTNRYLRSQTNSSGHSTLESHYSDRTLQPSPSHCSSPFGTIGLSRAQSLVKVQSLQSSPKSLHKKRKPILDEDSHKINSTSTPLSSPKINSSPAKNSPISSSSGKNIKTDPIKCDLSSTAVSANSSSNNSITLKLTTNTTTQNGTGTNTKVYVQNSPARSVITFENGNVTESSKGNNIFIFNDDRYSMTKPTTEEDNPQKNPVNVFMETTLDNFPTQKSENCNPSTEPYYPNNEAVKVQETKFNKNVINDKSMNNNRKLSLQLGNNQSNGLSYKNQLKNPAETVSSPGTPAIHNNSLGFDATGNSDPSTPTKSYDNVVDSIANKRYYEKNNLASANSHHELQKLNSNSDLKSVDLLMKAVAMQTNNRQSLYHSRMSSDSITSILSKSSDNKGTVIGSEPNLVFKNQENQNSPLNDNNYASNEKLNSEERNKKQKRYSLSQDIKNRNPEFYNFPSLSDLSFNFTSLAAQKILKGVSINSVDTLNELNMAANNGSDKQKNCEVTVCTDFGLV